MSEVGVGVIGLGFIGHTHIASYAAAGARLVAVCDRGRDALSGRAPNTGNIEGAAQERSFDPDALHATDDLDAFLSTPGLDLVSICTPTDTHEPLARRVIDAGKHLIVEKPVALQSETVASIGAAAEQAGVLCMPAMCMRFWPAWAWVKEAAADNRYGAVRSARFERLGARPTWGEGFYADNARSGGAIFDLHIHDTDFVTHLLGAPDAVLSVGDRDHVSTVYRFDDGPRHVSAQGGWLRSDAWGFRMRMLVEFESAVADFDLGRDPELRICLASGEEMVPTLSEAHGWAVEIAQMVNAVATSARVAPATMASAAVSTRVLEAELASLRSGGVIALP
jgi:predicted dehydrogenase